MAATIQGNTLTYHYVKQTSPSSGVPTTPEFSLLRRVSGDLDKNLTFTKSNEVDPSGQAGSNVLTQSEVAGSFDGEFPIASPDIHVLFESACRGEFTADINYTASTISFVNSTSKILDSADGFTDVVAGQYIGVWDTANQTTNLFFVTAKTDDGDITVAPAPVDESAGSAFTITGQNLRNGIEEVALAMQKRVPTAGGTEYNTFAGCQVASMSVNLTASSLLTTSFSIVGLGQEAGLTAVSGQTDAASPTAKIIGSVNGVESFFLDGVQFTPAQVITTDATIDISNGSAGVFAVGADAAIGLSFENITVGGTFTTYVDGTSTTTSYAEKLKALNETEFSLGLVMKDSSGNYLVIHRPYCQYTALERSNTANGDLLQNSGTIDANGKGALGYTVQVTYISNPNA